MAEDSICVVKTGATLAFTRGIGERGNSDRFQRRESEIRSTERNGGVLREDWSSGVAATTADLMLSAFESEVIAVGRQAYIAAIQVSAGGTLQISPLEDQ